LRQGDWSFPGSDAVGGLLLEVVHNFQKMLKGGTNQSKVGLGWVCSTLTTLLFHRSSPTTQIQSSEFLVPVSRQAHTHTYMIQARTVYFEVDLR
jgi:hypothetical protein